MTFTKLTKPVGISFSFSRNDWSSRSERECFHRVYNKLICNICTAEFRALFRYQTDTIRFNEPLQHNIPSLLLDLWNGNILTFCFELILQVACERFQTLHLLLIKYVKISFFLAQMWQDQFFLDQMWQMRKMWQDQLDEEDLVVMEGNNEMDVEERGRTIIMMIMKM